jgi:hypothetical protein
MEFAAALTSAKAAFDGLKLAIDARDDAKVKALTLELRERLFAMSDIAMAYIEKNAALTEELATLKLANAANLQADAEIENKRRERESYVLHQVAPGAFVYQYKPAVGAPQGPSHYVCQPCFDAGQKSVLQTKGTSTWLYCPTNSSHNINPNRSPPEQTRFY